ncbi:MAG: twin-arginine translocation signal domain-containing protein [Desulfobacteraceae bacterium]|nr:twin-arginine translocation signal domain-containing protein [Desulfobacteraceae bacterium]
MEETRRNFLKTGCAALAGATVATSINLVNAKDAGASPIKHPHGWPIKGLDPNKTKDLGYQGYYGKSRFSGAAGQGCASGVFGTIVGQLQETVIGDPEHPYHGIPLSMMQWGAGGVAGFGSLCGVLNGAGAAIGLACNNSDAKKYISDLLTWYSETALPIYPSPKYKKSHGKSIARSNLCHVSVTNWCLASGYASGSSQRSDRCACLCADTASKVVEMLNSGVGGVLGNPRDKNTTCGSCHYQGNDFDAGQFTHGKMDCNSCHVEIEKISVQEHHGDK